jgi:uncharacterized protein
MMDLIIENAKAFAKDIFSADSSGHDYHHTLRVWALARTIGEAEGADMAVVELAALLHDVDDHKLSPETAENKDRAVTFLRSQTVPESDIRKIVRIIDQISFSRNTLPPDTLEGKCVQDADRLDAMGAIGIARTFAFGGSHGRAMHDPDGSDRSSSIAHFYDKLLLLKDRMNTETGHRLAQHRHAYLEYFLAEFLSEWDGKC